MYVQETGYCDGIKPFISVSLREKEISDHLQRNLVLSLYASSRMPTRALQIRYQRPAMLTPSRERLLEAAKTLFAERGYEATSTAAICRLAGTSESQLIKHFRSKQGILEAIFQYAWEQLNPAVRLATESISSPRDKFKILSEMTLNFLSKDQKLCTLFLLEGRRIRDDGKLVILVPGFREFVKIVDAILGQLAEQEELSPHLHPQALRSALMGAIEGMLRDQILARSSRFPANYSDSDIRKVFFTLVACSLKK
jgi:AcrR family transcriptional regulator